MTDIAEKHRDVLETARSYRQRMEFIEAGEQYSMAAFLDLASGIPGNSSGGELRHLLEAATCYRIGNQKDRCRNRCLMGILRAEDLRERYRRGQPPDHAVHHADRGGWDEFIGDFRIVGDLDVAEDAYDRARSVYLEAGDPEAYRAESPNSILWAYFDDVETGATGESGSVLFRQDVTFSKFLDYKQEHLPRYIETLVERERWPIGEIDDSTGH